MDFLVWVRKGRSALWPICKYIYFFKFFRGAINFDDVLHAGVEKDLQKLSEIESKIKMDDPVNIQFTSGTTGNPKGACLSHHNIVNNGKFIGLRIGYDLKPHRICCAPPLYHTFGCVIGKIIDRVVVSMDPMGVS